MKIKSIIAILIVLFTASCTTVTKEPEVPEDFIVQNDTSSIQSTLSGLDFNDSEKITFQSGKSLLDDKTKEQINTWLLNEQPKLVAILGGAGAMKYQTLGEDRAVIVANYIRSKGFDCIIRNYTDTVPGGAAYLWSLNNQLTNQISTIAPMLIISGS